jgi:DNA-binding NtrC family response regulator
MGKKILIIDEHRFSIVCSAILENGGYKAETITNIDNLPAGLNLDDFGLIITSYPFGFYFLKEIKKEQVPKIIFSDQINDSLIRALHCIDNSYCMIKPLDYGKFKSLVKEVMSGNLAMTGGYSIV